MRLCFLTVRLLCVLAFLLPWQQASAAGEADLAAAAQKSNNPVSDAWILVSQYDYTRIVGDLTKGNEHQHRVSLQPVMPVPIFGGSWNLVNRVLLPVFSSAPVDQDSFEEEFADEVFGDRTEGLGDTVFFSLFAPNKDDGVIWGVGPTFILPTATDEVLGQEKWQAGPAALVVSIGSEHGGLGWKNWNVGALAQHWWDFAGSDNRDSVSQSDIQYFINWRVTPTQLIGMTPNIRIDWDQEGSDRFSVPVGLGTIGMFAWGKMPVRYGFEMQYYVKKRDNFGPDINFKFFIAPVAGNPFK